MLMTRSSRRPVAGENSRGETISSGPVLARVQRRPHRIEKRVVCSDVTSSSQDTNQTTKPGENHCSDDDTGLDSHGISISDQNVTSLSATLREQDPVEPPARIGEDKKSNRISEEDYCKTGGDCIRILRGPSPDLEINVNQPLSRVLDDARCRKSDQTDSCSTNMQKNCAQLVHEPTEYAQNLFEDGADEPKEFPNDRQVEDPLAWLIRTGEVIVIDPEDTIPLTCIREVTEAGVSKLERSFLGEEGSSMSKGVSSAGSQPVVVRIPQDQLRIVRDHFRFKKGISEENADAISRSKRWIGVVDGAYRRRLLLRWGQKYPERYKGYGWVVLQVDWQPLEVLRAFARARNELQRGENLVAFTVYDVFKNLKQCADEIALSEGIVDGRHKNRGYLKRVADHYCRGGNTANNLTRQLAGIAVVLSWSVIEVMGEILNTEDSNATEAISAGSELDYDRDTRVYRNIFTRSTFRGATTFKTVASEEDQINVLRRFQFLSPQRKYKPVSKNELECQVKKAISARREVEKMEQKLQRHEWPIDMAAIKRTLLTRTTLDNQVEANKNSDEILPELADLWRSLFPIAAELEDAKRISSEALSPNSVNEREVWDSDCVSHADNSTFAMDEKICRTLQESLAINDDHTSGNSEQRDIDTADCMDVSDSAKRIDNISDEEVAENKTSEDGTEGDTLCPLRQLSVRAENKSWREFQLGLLSEELFDFIYADPQQSLSSANLKQGLWTEFKDERKISEFANFCRITLRPGCYCFMVVLPSEHDIWVSAFQKEGMKVMTSPFLIIPSSGSSRVTLLKELPKACGELAVVARSPGRSTGFKVNFEKPYGRIKCSYTRKFGIIDNVPCCMNPLRAHNLRVELRSRERHPDLISEILDTFCAPTGAVLDPFGGVLTTALSCIATQRPCVVLEKDSYCYEEAIRRLEKLCRDQLLNPDEARKHSSGTNVEEDLLSYEGETPAAL